MYEYLEGRLVDRRPTALVLDVGGVGYEVAVPFGASFGDGAASGEAIRVWTHFVVREDLQALYGFPDARMRELFRLLLKVRGVGPGLALAVLSTLPGTALLEAIATNDVAALTRVKGVGKKTAEQILLDLRDRAPTPQASEPEVTLVPRGGAARILEDARQALTSIGYTEKEAQKSVSKAAEKVGTDDLERLVRTAISS